MSWSYDATDLDVTTATGRLNTIRLLVGDTETLDQQVQNEEITFGLSQNNNSIYNSASWVARVISASYARRVTSQIDGELKAEYSDLMSHYASLSDDLRNQGKTLGSVLGVQAGGMTISGVDAVRADDNRVAPQFRMDQFKNPPRYNKPEYE